MFHLLASGKNTPDSIFSKLYRSLEGTAFDQFFKLSHNHEWGMYWFEAMCFSVIVATIMVIGAAVVTPTYKKIPTGLQNVLELAVEMLRKFVLGLVGPHGERYVGYVGTLFLFIFLMNLVGLIPGCRAPTMTISTTLALGLTTFVYVQGSSIAANGLLGHIKHLAGPVIGMAPLMFFIELIGECVKPFSLSLRLYGNIYGEDMVIENFMALGSTFYFPLQFPMYLFGIFTSFLQAFIFSALTCIYLSLLTAHEGGDHH